jgi:hypothetical protein
MESIENDDLKADEQWSRIAADLNEHRAAQRRAWGDVDEAAIARYVTGEGTEAERERLEQAMRDYPRVRECVESIRAIMGDLPLEGIRAAETPRPAILPFASRPRRAVPRLRGVLVFATAAAAILVALTARLTVFRSASPSALARKRVGAADVAYGLHRPAPARSAMREVSLEQNESLEQNFARAKELVRLAQALKEPAPHRFPPSLALPSVEPRVAAGPSFVPLPAAPAPEIERPSSAPMVVAVVSPPLAAAVPTPSPELVAMAPEARTEARYLGAAAADARTRLWAVADAPLDGNHPWLRDILAQPEKFEGQETTPRGVFRLGKLMSDDKDGTSRIEVMQSGLRVNFPQLTAAANAGGEAATLDIEPNLAEKLLTLRPWQRDSAAKQAGDSWEKHVAILTVRVLRDRRSPDKATWIHRIRSVEFLLNVDGTRLSQGQSPGAFQTFTVTTDHEGAGKGDTADWLARLGTRFRADARLVARTVLARSLAQRVVDTAERPATSSSGVVRLKTERTPGVASVVKRPGPTPPPVPDRGAILDPDIHLDYKLP